MKPPYGANLHRHWRTAVPLMMVAVTAAWLASRERTQAPANDGAEALFAPAALVVPSAQAQTPAQTREQAQTPDAASAGTTVVDIFAPRTWEPPPPPPPPAAAAPPPQAPPLPFRYFGRITEPGKPDVFLLLEGERIHRVRVGDTIGSSYRVDKFDRGRLLLRYRPMNVTQALAVDNPT